MLHQKIKANPLLIATLSLLLAVGTAGCSEGDDASSNTNNGNNNGNGGLQTASVCADFCDAQYDGCSEPDSDAAGICNDWEGDCVTFVQAVETNNEFSDACVDSVREDLDCMASAPTCATVSEWEDNCAQELTDTNQNCGGFW